jgi:hypothetical protein
LEGNSCLLSGGAPDSPVHHRTATVACLVRISFHSWRSRPLDLRSGAPPDSHCSMSGADLLPFLAQPTIGSSGWLAHRTLSGAHRIVRCPQPTVGWGHASRADCTADRCAGGRWLTGQSGAPPDSPVNYSHTPPTNSQEWPVRESPAWRIGHCLVHPD